MTIKNFTPHEINILSGATFSQKDRKYVVDHTTQVVKVIKPEGTLLSVQQINEDKDPIDGIPTKRMEFGSDLLHPSDCYCIVSAMYVSACRQHGVDTSNLLTIGDGVYDPESMKPVGTLNLNRN